VIRFVIAFVGLIAATSAGMIRPIEPAPSFMELLATVVLAGGGSLLLWWFVDTRQPSRRVRITFSIASAVLLLFLSGTLIGAVFEGNSDPDPRLFFRGLLIGVLWCLPTLLAAKTTALGIRDGCVRIVRGVFRRNTLTIPFYQIMDVGVNQSGAGYLTGAANLSLQYKGADGSVLTTEARGVGTVAELQALALQIKSMGNDLRSGAWRAGVNYWWAPGNANRLAIQTAIARRTAVQRKRNVAHIGNHQARHA
jgi:hypothetical protein